MPGIVWLASYPKSGNTWVRAFLANFLADAPEPVPINDLPKHLLGDNFLIHYKQFTGKDPATLSRAEIQALRPKIHRWFAYSRPDNTIVKTHNAVAKIDGQPLITPSATAGAIYVVRNPLDVAVSFAHHYQTDYDRAVEALCDDDYVLPPSGGQLEQYLGSWSQHVRSWTTAPGLPVYVVRYEDMHRKPMKAMGGLIKFLALPEDKARLKKAIKFSAFRELQSQERQERFVEARPDEKARFFREGRIGTWRNALSESQTDRLAACHEAMMTTYGYMNSQGRLTD